LGVGALVLFAAGSALAYRERTARAHTCDDAAHEGDSVWNEARARAGRGAVARTGLSYAGPTWASVEPALAAYADGWSQLGGAACTDERNGSASEIARRKDACLTDRYDELDHTVKLFAEADAKTVQNALPAVEALTPLARCKDARSLAAPPDAT